MKTILFLFAISWGFLDSNAMGTARKGPDPVVVPTVQLDRYSGFWYEVAHSPNFFQRKCISSTAEYKVINEGSVSVHNTCYHSNGKITDIDGIATVLDPAVPSKLRVVFKVFAGFKVKGDYWITELDPNYQWAVVSGPGKAFNFILSRTPSLKPEVKAEIFNTLKEKGFNVDEFILDQPLDEGARQ